MNYTLKKENWTDSDSPYRIYSLLKNGKSTGVDISYSKPAGAKKYMYRVGTFQSSLRECGSPKMRVTFKTLHKAFSFAIHLSKYRYNRKKYPTIKTEGENHG